jgi:hypothetical protein
MMSCAFVFAAMTVLGLTERAPKNLRLYWGQLERNEVVDTLCSQETYGGRVFDGVLRWFQDFLYGCKVARCIWHCFGIRVDPEATLSANHSEAKMTYCHQPHSRDLAASPPLQQKRFIGLDCLSHPPTAAALPCPFTERTEKAEAKRLGLTTPTHVTQPLQAFRAWRRRFIIQLHGPVGGNIGATTCFRSLSQRPLRPWQIPQALSSPQHSRPPSDQR